MTTISIPRKWATDTNFSSGASSGTPTKVDPGAAQALQGFVPGVTPFSPAQVNKLLHDYSAISRRAFTVAALNLREARRHGFVPSDTSESCGVFSPGQSQDVWCVKSVGGGTNSVAFMNDTARLAFAPNELVSITSLVTDVAYKPNPSDRAVAIGTGGNRCAFLTNLDGTWTAGGDIGHTPHRIVWNATHSLFIVTPASGNTIRRSADATSWSSGTASHTTSSGGIAVLSSGRTVVFGMTGAVIDTSYSDDGGATWGDISPSFDATDYTTESGCVVGNGGEYIYHVGRLSAQETLRVRRSSDGMNWTTIAELTTPNPTAESFNAAPRIMMCQNTGLLVIVCEIFDSEFNPNLMFASADGGLTWTDPMVSHQISVNAYGVAGGKVVMVHDDMYFISSGIGWV